jgi:hypothetical protein
MVENDDPQHSEFTDHDKKGGKICPLLDKVADYSSLLLAVVLFR